MNPDYVPSYEHCVLPYIQWYQDDFVGGIRGMKAHEIGVYTVLLMEMYARGHALDQTEERLARMCGSDRRTFSKVLDGLVGDGKIIRLKCGLWNERCENAFRERAKMQEQNSSAAKAGWEKRRQNNAHNEHPQSERNAVVMPNSEAQSLIKEETNVSSKKRAFRLSPDWQCPDEWIDEAVDAGMSRPRAISEAERMKNWSLSSKNGAKLDWRAAWRNWYKGKLDEAGKPRDGRGEDGHLTNDFLFGGGRGR
ncbi:hypothetical protein DEM27_05805 [Metarhizobium album]|uniref:DUF1376 domain-containing protein n=1 Tax=Metarhizobium album TaxID=2182425 RepID=A0A2U2DV08_9HYPH|nr:DUF1376 domain-containing protein [Rhizobium album]PWE57155.1 hypothetical protein DEM27_05805 [Rhizobium album]